MAEIGDGAAAAVPSEGVAGVVSDDHVPLATRFTAGLLVPFPLVGFVILFLFPSETERFFAWTIRPTMTPMLMGAGYLAGTYFFLRVLKEHQWHRVALAFPAIATFAACMAVATAVHWDRFNQAHPAFWVWTLLYATSPVLVFALWLAGRRSDPMTMDSRDAAVPTPFRLVFAAAGSVVLAGALGLMLLPTMLINTWPWQLTQLTGRVMGGWLALGGIVALGIAIDQRWSAARIVLESLMLGIVLIFVAVARAWTEFAQGSMSSWAFILGIVALLGLSAVLYARMELGPKGSEQDA